MALKEIQKRVGDWVAETKTGYFPPLPALARLMEETGELAREMNHRFGVKKKKPDENTAELADEIADIVFTLVCIANPLGLDLDKAFDRMMTKLEERDKDRWGQK